jgi:hypothetical protein
MSWKIILMKEKGYVQISYAGNVTSQDLAEGAQAVLKLGLEHNFTKCLTDCKHIDIPPDVRSMYENLIYFFDKIELNKSYREAMILPVNKKAAEYVLFYEVACTNRGYTVKTFESEQDAVAWLMS